MKSHRNKNSYWQDVAQDKKVHPKPIQMNFAAWNIRTMLQRDIGDFCDTRAMRGACCNTDHILIKSSTQMEIRRKITKRRTVTKKLGVEKLKRLKHLDVSKTESGSTKILQSRPNVLSVHGPSSQFECLHDEAPEANPGCQMVASYPQPRHPDEN